jgi:hypothetical protein
MARAVSIDQVIPGAAAFVTLCSPPNFVKRGHISAA